MDHARYALSIISYSEMIVLPFVAMHFLNEVITATDAAVAPQSLKVYCGFIATDRSPVDSGSCKTFSMFAD